MDLLRPLDLGRPFGERLFAPRCSWRGRFLSQDEPKRNPHRGSDGVSVPRGGFEAAFASGSDRAHGLSIPSPALQADAEGIARVARWRLLACHRRSPVGSKTRFTLTRSESPTSLDPWLLSRMQYALPQQVEFSPAVHLPLDQFEAIHLPLKLGVAPRSLQDFHQTFMSYYQGW